MISVAEFDLSGQWLTRDGRVVMVRKSKRPIAAYIATFEDGHEHYVTVEGNGYESHHEIDLVEYRDPDGRRANLR